MSLAIDIDIDILFVFHKTTYKGNEYDMEHVKSNTLYKCLESSKTDSKSST
jgi:hypothetical protein